MDRRICPTCHIPTDAGFFDESTISTAPGLGPGEQQEVVLAEYRLHRNYTGVLLYFAQFATSQREAVVETPGYRWEIRCSGQPLDPYLSMDHIVNPWGLNGFPLALRIPEGSVLQFVVSAVGDSDPPLVKVGGRILGRYWYNTDYGGAPNRL
ncbi:MAG: hypothetical protein U0Z70_22590 [Thermomicrobiales bacterium]